MKINDHLIHDEPEMFGLALLKCRTLAANNGCQAICAVIEAKRYKMCKCLVVCFVELTNVHKWKAYTPVSFWPINTCL